MQGGKVQMSKIINYTLIVLMIACKRHSDWGRYNRECPSAFISGDTHAGFPRTLSEHCRRAKLGRQGEVSPCNPLFASRLASLGGATLHLEKFASLTARQIGGTPFNKLKDACLRFNQFYLQIGKIFQFLGFLYRRNLLLLRV